MSKKPTPIVTRESLIRMLNEADMVKRGHIVGRAMVALFNRQTASEQHSNTTLQSNGVGFSGSDSIIGSLTAKSYLKNHTLAPWQIEQWTKPMSNGFPKLCKYVRQLNEIAQEKRNNHR